MKKKWVKLKTKTGNIVEIQDDLSKVIEILGNKGLKNSRGTGPIDLDTFQTLITTGIFSIETVGGVDVGISTLTTRKDYREECADLNNTLEERKKEFEYLTAEFEQAEKLICVLSNTLDAFGDVRKEVDVSFESLNKLIKSLLKNLSVNNGENTPHYSRFAKRKSSYLATPHSLNKIRGEIATIYETLLNKYILLIRDFERNYCTVSPNSLGLIENDIFTIKDFIEENNEKAPFGMFFIESDYCDVLLYPPSQLRSALSNVERILGFNWWEGNENESDEIDDLGISQCDCVLIYSTNNKFARSAMNAIIKQLIEYEYEIEGYLIEAMAVLAGKKLNKIEDIEEDEKLIIRYETLLEKYKEFYKKLFVVSYEDNDYIVYNINLNELDDDNKDNTNKWRRYNFEINIEPIEAVNIGNYKVLNLELVFRGQFNKLLNIIKYT